MALGDSPAYVFIGIAIWGLHMGLTEGLLAALTADHAPVELRGTAFGVVNLVRGVMLFVASLLAGGIWTNFGAQTTFLTGAVLAAITAVVVLGGAGNAARCAGQPRRVRLWPGHG